MLNIFRRQVIKGDGTLNPREVEKSLEQAFDLIDKINPPSGASYTSSILNQQFVDAYTLIQPIKLIVLHDEVFSATTVQCNWNSHQLFYNGVEYTIAAGSTTDEYIFWSPDSPSAYVTYTTYPDPIPIGGLIATYDILNGLVYEVWNTQLGAGSIGGTAIGDISASKIITGTIRPDVNITFSESDTIPTVLTFGTVGALTTAETGDITTLQPLTTDTGEIAIGKLDTSNRWLNVGALATAINLDAQDSTPDYCGLQLQDSTITFFFDVTGSTRSDGHILTSTLFEPHTTNIADIGSTTTRWKNLFLSGDATIAGDASVLDDPYGAGWNGSTNVPTKNAVYDKIQTLLGSSAYTISNVTTDRTYDANATTVDELADVIGTLVADLQGKGILS